MSLKVCDRLVFNDRDISNFCKSFVYLKAIAEKDAALRERLANGFSPWDLEGGINATFMFYPDWFDIDSTNRLSKPNVAREFNKFLVFILIKLSAMICFLWRDMMISVLG